VSCSSSNGSKTGAKAQNRRGFVVSALRQDASATIFTTKGTKDTKKEKTYLAKPWLLLRLARRKRGNFHHEGHEEHEGRKNYLAKPWLLLRLNHNL
jgi:hypothetical protein